MVAFVSLLLGWGLSFALVLAREPTKERIAIQLAIGFGMIIGYVACAIFNRRPQ